MNRKEVLEAYCDLSSMVAEKIWDHRVESDCFRGKNVQMNNLTFEFSQAVMNFIKDAVDEKIGRELDKRNAPVNLDENYSKVDWDKLYITPAAPKLNRAEKEFKSTLSEKPASNAVSVNSKAYYVGRLLQMHRIRHYDFHQGKSGAFSITIRQYMTGEDDDTYAKFRLFVDKVLGGYTQSFVWKDEDRCRVYKGKFICGHDIEDLKKMVDDPVIQF